MMKLQKFNSAALAFLLMVTTASSVVYGMEEDPQRAASFLNRRKTKEYVDQNIVPQFGHLVAYSSGVFSKHNLSEW